MDNNFLKTILSSSEIILETNVELSVEDELSIPDYRPSVFKVLKVISEPVIMQKLIVGNRVTVEGYIKATVIYLSDEKPGIFGMGTRLAFSKQLDAKQDAGDTGSVFASPKISYLNCRATNKRKLDIRGAVSVDIKATREKQLEIIDGNDKQKVEFLNTDLTGVKIIEQAEKRFTLEEEIEIDTIEGMTPELIRSSTEAVVETTTCFDGYIEVSGYFIVSTAFSYCNEEEYFVRRFVYTVPFNQTIDAKNSTSSLEASSSIKIISGSVQSERMSGGANEVSITSVITATATEPQTITAAIDAFSPKHEVVIEKTAVSFQKETIDINLKFESTLKTSKMNNQKLVDCFVETETLTAEISEGGMIVGKGEVCVIVSSIDDVETKQVVFEISETPTTVINSFAPGLKLPVIIENVDWTESEQSIDIVVTGYIKSNNFSMDKVDVITKIDIKQDQPKPKSPYSLSVYYSPGDETVFEIAKRFNSLANVIKTENNLTDELIEQPTMLLIPNLSV